MLVGHEIRGIDVKTRFARNLLRLMSLLVILWMRTGGTAVQAESLDAWWNEAWPYRLLVTVDGSDTSAAQIDFSSVFTELGIEGALLDLRSIRVVPYQNGIPADPIPYEETYSELFIDGETLNVDPDLGLPYWFVDELFSLSIDEGRFSQGTGSIHAHFEFVPESGVIDGFHYIMNDPDLGDWSAYETLIYDVWPGVNESALDQTTDLYFFELEGVKNCAYDRVNAPPLSLGKWNYASVSLEPFGMCASPDASMLDGFYFYLNLASLLNEYSGYGEGDELDLWLDNFRLVDQDGAGEIRWEAQQDVDSYYIYFDTLNHEGHPLPELTTVGEGAADITIGTPEAGGYYHLVAGAETGDLEVWCAPTSEKILQTNTPPVNSESLMIFAAKGEFESLQLVIHSPIEQALVITVSDLMSESAVIPANQVDLFRVDYVEIAQLSDSFGRLGLWPDPLYPVSLGEEIPFKADVNQPLWFRVEVPANAQPGVYTGTIQIGSATIPFSLNVWDFYLSRNTGLETRIGFDWAAVLEMYGGTAAGEPQACYDQLVQSITETFSEYRLTPSQPEEPGAPEDVLLYSLTEYEVSTAQTQQAQSGEQVWWEFTVDDLPPFANPSVIDRPGMDARIFPWLVWLDRVDGFYYHQSADWDPDPWSALYSDTQSNGDGFLFYPPKDDTLGYDPCEFESNRLVPSIRLELLREGLEDYALFRLLNGQDPEIGVENDVDIWVGMFIYSRTSFQRIPSVIESTRIEIAGLIQGKSGEYYFPLMFH